MARILAISSQVARGTVGLSVIVPALHAMGHEVIGLPTVVLSNHPGHAQVAGTCIEAAVLHAMLDALEANGWLDDIDAVLTGYLPSVAHVAFAAEAVHRVRESRGAHPALYLCDPVLGDDPKGLYIDRSAADAIGETLMPLADVTTPNRFELSFLTGRDVRGPGDVAGPRLFRGHVVATSIPSDRPQHVSNVAGLWDRASLRQKRMTHVPSQPGAPHGTGDLFSALLLSAWPLDGRGDRDAGLETGTALAFATAGVDLVLAASRGDTLAVGSLPRHGQDLAWPVENPVAERSGLVAPIYSGRHRQVVVERRRRRDGGRDPGDQT